MVDFVRRKVNNKSAGEQVVVVSTVCREETQRVINYKMPCFHVLLTLAAYIIHSFQFIQLHSITLLFLK